MTIDKPGAPIEKRSLPEFRVVEDGQGRLVLQTGGGRLIAAAVLAVLGAAMALGWWMDQRLRFALVLAAICLGGAAFFALVRQRWTFDAVAGRVRFETRLGRGWEARMASVSNLRIETKASGSADQLMMVAMLLMTVDGRPGPRASTPRWTFK
jgi:hypothetical protein